MLHDMPERAHTERVGGESPTKEKGRAVTAMRKLSKLAKIGRRRNSLQGLPRNCSTDKLYGRSCADAGLSDLHDSLKGMDLGYSELFDAPNTGHNMEY